MKQAYNWNYTNSRFEKNFESIKIIIFTSDFYLLFFFIIGRNHFGRSNTNNSKSPLCFTHYVCSRNKPNTRLSLKNPINPFACVCVCWMQACVVRVCMCVKIMLPIHLVIDDCCLRLCYCRLYTLSISFAPSFRSPTLTHSMRFWEHTAMSAFVEMSLLTVWRFGQYLFDWVVDHLPCRNEIRICV